MSKVDILQEEFKIMVGPSRGSEALIGKLEKGQATISGQYRKAPPFNGYVMFPNYIQAWGRRVIDGKVPEGTRVEVNDLKYQGEIEWLKNDDNDGYLIYARYVPGQSSLDYQYQITRLGLPNIKNDEENAYRRLSYGEISIVPSKDKAWATFIQIHYMNQDSLAKMPTAEGNMWRMVKVLDTKKTEAKEIDEAFKAVSIVKECADSFKKLDVLRIVIEKRHVLDYDKTDETSMYDALILYANDKASEFMASVDDYKRNVSEVLSLSESFEVIDMKNKGELVALKPNKDILLTGIPAKGDKMIEWLFERCFNPDVHEAIEKLNQIVSKFK